MMKCVSIFVAKFPSYAVDYNPEIPETKKKDLLYDHIKHGIPQFDA